MVRDQSKALLKFKTSQLWEIFRSFLDERHELNKKYTKDLYAGVIYGEWRYFRDDSYEPIVRTLSIPLRVNEAFSLPCLHLELRELENSGYGDLVQKFREQLQSIGYTEVEQRATIWEVPLIVGETLQIWFLTPPEV